MVDNGASADGLGCGGWSDARADELHAGKLAEFGPVGGVDLLGIAPVEKGVAGARGANSAHEVVG